MQAQRGPDLATSADLGPVDVVRYTATVGPSERGRHANQAATRGSGGRFFRTRLDSPDALN